ncbi:MAG: caspase family protein [Treponema sp.]|nr:caspase family protein [Treponema sp.]
MMQKKRMISYAIWAFVMCSSVLSADQRGIAVVGTVQQHDQSGTMQGTLTVAMGHGQQINSLAYSPDGKYLVTGSDDKTVKLWNTETGQELWTFSGTDAEVKIVRYCPDGKYIAAGLSSDYICILDSETGKQITSFKNPNTLADIVYSPDGTRLYTTEYQSIDIYDAVSGTAAGQFTVFTGDEQVNSFAVSPEGRTLAAGGNEGSIVLYNTEDGSLIRKISHAHKNYIGNIYFSPDGTQFASGGYQDDHNVRIWTIGGKPVKTIDTFETDIIGLDFSSDGTYLAMIDSFQNYVLYNIKTKQIEQKCKMEDVGTSPECLSFSPDGQYVAAAGFCHVVTIWDVRQNKTKRLLAGSADEVKAVAYRPDGKQIISGAGETLRQWDETSGVQEKLIPNNRIPYTVIYSRDGTQLFVNSDNFNAAKCDIQTGKMTVTAAESSSLLAVSADDSLCISASLSDDIEITDLSANTMVYEIKKPFGNDSIASLAVNPAGSILAAGCNSIKNNMVKIWDIKGRLIATVSCFSGPVGCVTFSPDGKYLYMLDIHGNFLSWDIQNQKAIQNIDLRKELTMIPSEERSGGSVLKFSSDGKFIATGNQTGMILLFDSAEFPRNPHIFTGHKGWINSLAFSSDGTRLISGSNDGTVKIWDTTKGNCLVTMLNAKNGEWLSWTDEGYYTGSEWAAKNLVYFVNGRDVIGIDQMYDTLYRPDLVAAKLAGEDISGYIPKSSALNSSSGSTENNLPPNISIVQLPASTDKRDITVEIRATDNGGGIGAVNLCLNGKIFPVATDTASRKNDIVSFRYLITVQNGKNTVSAQAYNKNNTIESQSPEKQVTWAGNTEKPRFFILAVATNKYRAQGLQLKYSVADADGITNALQKSAGNLYKEVIIKKVYDADVTADGINAAFDSLAGQIQADDVFVFYLAGHGVTYDEDGDYYYLPVTFRFTDKTDIPAQGISKKMIMQNLAKIKAGKSIVLMDTCSSGTFVAGTRSGLSEATAINRLTRATGSATIAAGSDEQVAMEGYNGHGIFTYVLMDGLSGKADSNKDGFITLQELCSYAEYEVPELSYEKWGYEQVPQKQLRDEDFPIGTDK